MPVKNSRQVFADQHLNSLISHEDSNNILSLIIGGEPGRLGKVILLETWDNLFFFRVKRSFFEVNFVDETVPTDITIADVYSRLYWIDVYGLGAFEEDFSFIDVDEYEYVNAGWGLHEMEPSTIKWNSVSSVSGGTRVGGLPLYAVNQTKILYPFMKYEGVWHPMLFLGQIAVDNDMVYVFSGFSKDEDESFAYPFGFLGSCMDKVFWEQLYSEEFRLSPLWVEDIPVKSVTAASASAHPPAPEWVQYKDVSEEAPDFLFQLPNFIAGIDVNYSPSFASHYVFWDGSGRVEVSFQTT